MNNRLLILDDDSEFTAYAGAVGKGAGYEVLEITDALNFESTLKSWLPSHVMVDLHMPAIDGLEALQILARSQSAAKVVLCSAAARDFIQAADRLGAHLKLNMCGMIEKPPQVAELKAFLEGLKDKTSVPVPNHESFDRSSFDAVYDLMGRNCIHRGLATLITRCESTFTEQMLESPDRGQLARSAHSLVSCAGILGFSELSRLCRELEEACDRDGDLSTRLYQAQVASRIACGKAREVMAGLREEGAN